MSTPPANPSAATAVELESITLTAAGRVLLDNANARFEPGKVTLIVGCSGTGKSLLLRAIAGLMDASHREITITGKLRIDGREMLHERGPRPVGIVFQQFALFDELTPSENVRFAHAHSPKPRQSADTAPDALLDELQVPRGVRTSALSGGQQQRLAIARTLTYNPDVVLYDEPTSGLDVATAAQVAQLISQTHASHPRTSIVVTHDYEALSPIADAIYLLDAQSQSLRLVPRGDWPRIGAMMKPPASAEPPARPTDWPSRIQRVIAATPQAAGDFFAASSRAAEAALLLPWRLVPLWKSPAWGLRYLLHYLRLVAGVSAWAYIALTGLIIGFVATHFTFRFIPYARYTEPLIIENLLSAVGYALYRILIPIFATVLMAARCGAAVASDVGGKTYGRQVDALRSFGAKPENYLLTNILYAYLVGAPLLVAMSFFVAKAVSLVVFVAAYPDRGPQFWRFHFHNEIRIPGQLFYIGTGWMLAKVLCCAVGIALISYHRGAMPKTSSRAVSGGITSAILWATLYVLIVHFIFAFIEFD